MFPKYLFETETLEVADEEIEVTLLENCAYKIVTQFDF